MTRDLAYWKLWIGSLRYVAIWWAYDTNLRLLRTLYVVALLSESRSFKRTMARTMKRLLPLHDTLRARALTAGKREIEKLDREIARRQQRGTG